jgi:uncharacterized protein with GYD domain
MEFVILGKFRRRPTKDTPVQANKLMEEAKKEGIKFVKMYWTLGRYDTAAIVEAPNERAVMKWGLAMSEILATETLVAVPRDEAIKWL